MSSSPPSTYISDPQALQHHYQTALKQFASSSSDFQILYTATASSSSSSSSSSSYTSPPTPSSPLTNLRTLYILDSSFNPPTHAHYTLAHNALLNDSGSHPRRMLFLLATSNADKPTKPAPFADRLVMMSIVAQRLCHAFSSSSYSSSSSTSTSTSSSSGSVSVDVGVTKKPFFMDKAAAIDESQIYPSTTQQVHLTGFDTIVRIFNPKYYAPEEGLSVLEPFLARHRLRVCYRQGEGEEGEKEREEQERYVEGIGDGSRESEGMRREWRSMVELVDDAKEVSGVSSTRARRAGVEGRKEDLRELVGEEVAEWVVGEGLYVDEEAVKKEGIKPRD